MSDFEKRLSEELAQRAERAPGVEGLAQAARTRQSRRRTARIAVASAAAVVVAAGVPFGVSLLGTEHNGDGHVTTQPEPRPSAEGVPGDWRWESWHDVEFAVPPSWGYGSLSQHCISSDDNPVVERPNMASTLVACTPSLGYGVLISNAELAPDAGDPSLFPRGATVKATTVDGVVLTVVTQDAGVAETVLGSARTYPGPDFYGCEAQVDVPALGAMPPGGDFSRRDPISVCRYDAGVDGPNLTASDTLEGDEIEKAWLGIDALKPGDGPNPSPQSCLESPESEAVLLRSGGQDWFWVHYSGCTTHGVDVGGDVFQLNEQIMWAAISPNWGGWGASAELPLPKEFRR